MAEIYGSGSGTRRTYTPATIGRGGSKIKPAAENKDAGKGSINLFDVPGSLGDTGRSLAEFGGGLIGGIAGKIGELGPDAETASIGQLAEDIGRIPGGIGDIQLPYLGNDPNQQPARLSEIPGKMLDIVALPGRAVERTYAGQRVEQAKQGRDLDLRNSLYGLPVIGGLAGEDAENRGLPPDLMARLEAGESVDVIADELVERGQGFSGGGLTNVAGQIMFDPLNLIAPGASKLAGGIKQAGYAVQVPAQYAKMGLTQRAAGVAYNTASRNMSAAGAALVDKTLGPVTSGVFHALGTKPYRAITGALARESPEYAASLDDALAVASGNLNNAVLADEAAQDLTARLFVAGDDIDATLAAQLTGKRSVAPDALERRAEEMLSRTTPEFLTETPEELAEIAARHLSIVSDIPIETARRVVGPTATREMAQTTHFARYGRAVDDFAEAREATREAAAASGKKPNIDFDRLTPIADDTLTTERAAMLADAAPGTLRDEAMKYSVISDHFLGKNPSDGDILAFVEKLKEKGALVEAVKLPKAGKNKLPDALGAWRQKYRDNGYDLGFAPKDGMKTLTDADGNIVWSKPFVHVTTRRDPVTMRNGLGRAMDGLFRGVTQTTIVQQSRIRMVRFVADNDLPISPNQVRSIHKAIIDEAASRVRTPRSLAAEKVRGSTGASEPYFDDIFRKFLSDDEYAALTQKFDPTYVVMRAFEGNWKTVGLTQKFTGRLKSIPVIARITEDLYPKARFSYRPNFQLQEMIESPTFNQLRGIGDRVVDEDVAKVYAQLSELPQFKYLADAHYLNIAGNRLVHDAFFVTNNRLGRALSSVANIQGRKNVARIRQVMAEHGEDFKEAVQSINPRVWRAMEEAYGTADPRIIADRFLAERIRLAGGKIDDAMAAVDEAAGNPSWASTPEGATVWQAFKDSFENRSRIAFQTHFFNPQRGWLERTMNHPYLGLYPLSYMWGKVLPEFARFLVARPFGIKAPMVGAAGLARVQQAYVGALATDPEFSDFIESNAAAIYFANLMFPGNPTNLSVNAPAWARHISTDARAGRDINLNTVGREIQDTAAYALNPVSDVTTFGKPASDVIGGAEDVYTQLERAAELWTNQFGQ